MTRITLALFLAMVGGGLLGSLYHSQFLCCLWGFFITYLCLYVGRKDRF